jgi:predicted DNA-binding transcriptional regulator AlpA
MSQNKNKIVSETTTNSTNFDKTESAFGQKFFEKLIWGIDEVCTFTSYAKGTIYNLVSKGEIPVHRRNRKGKLVFIPSEVIAWFKGE